MKLTTLRLRNFKGCRDFTLSGDNDIAIFGDNGTGKTTLFDAFTWLLFDKDSANHKDFEIKTLDENGKPLHGLSHEVEGVLDLDGMILTLKKAYHENWAKKRGQAAKEFSGHSTDYFLDGVPSKKAEYEAKIADIVDEDVFKLLTNPRYFNEILHWQDRREILLKVCGDVDDKDVIASNDALADLPGILNGRRMSDHRKVVMARRTEISRELGNIPVRIDEIQRGLPLVDNSEAIVDSLTKLKMQRKEHWNQTAGKIQATKVELRGYTDKADALNDTLSHNLRQAEYDGQEAVGLEKIIEGLTQKRKEINAEEFTFDQSDTCPTCGQKLPVGKVKVAREKALAEFRADRASRRNRVIASNAIEQSNLDAVYKRKAFFEQQLSEIQPKLVKINKKIADTEGLILSLEKQEADNTKDTRIDNQIAELEYQLAQVEQRKSGLQRIEELKEHESKLVAEHEGIERALYLMEQFTRTKVKLLEERVNSMFEFTKWKLFNLLVNGGIEEICEATYDGVSYGSGLNNGMRIAIGLDVINTLQKFYGSYCPVWIDQAESFYHLPKMNCQQIKLYVSEADEILRIENK